MEEDESALWVQVQVQVQMFEKKEKRKKERTEMGDAICSEASFGWKKL